MPPIGPTSLAKNLGGNNPGDLGLGWRRSEGRLLFFMQDGADTSNLEESEKVDETYFPRWYHVAVTWNTADSMRIFVDGKQQAAIESAVPFWVEPWQWPSETVRQTYGMTGYEGFRGMIDEVRVSVVERYTETFAFQLRPMWKMP